MPPHTMMVEVDGKQVQRIVDHYEIVDDNSVMGARRAVPQTASNERVQWTVTGQCIIIKVSA